MTTDNQTTKKYSDCLDIMLVSFLYALSSTIFCIFYDGKELFTYPVIITIIIELAIIVYVLIKLYKAWKSIQILQNYDILEKWKMPIPGKAVGFLFIPIFNLYWIFIAYSTLLNRANRLADELKLTHLVKFYPSIGFLYATCFVLSFIIGIESEETYGHLNYLLAAIDCVLFILTYWQIKKVIRTFSSYQSNPVASPPSPSEAI